MMPSTLVKTKEDAGAKVGDDRKGGPLLNSPSERVKAQLNALVLDLRALGPSEWGGPLTEFAVGARQSSTKCSRAGPAGAWPSSATLMVAQQVRFREGAVVPMPPGTSGPTRMA